MRDKKLVIKIACVRCNDYFELIPGEAFEFIREKADIKYLKRVKFPKDKRRFFRTRENYIKALIEYHCPYCREVVFGKPFIFDYTKNRAKLSEDKYLKAIEKEARDSKGFSIIKEPHA